MNCQQKNHTVPCMGMVHENIIVHIVVHYNKKNTCDSLLLFFMKTVIREKLIHETHSMSL